MKCVHTLICCTLLVPSYAQKKKAPVSPGWDLMPVTDKLWMDARETNYADWFNFIAAVGPGLPLDSIAQLLPDTSLLHPTFRRLVESMLSDASDDLACSDKIYESSILSYKIAKVEKKKLFTQSELPQSRSCDKNGALAWEYPVTGITYAQATAYIDWRNRAIEDMTIAYGWERWVCRLPTATEWEVLARASYEASLKKASDTASIRSIYTRNGRNTHGCLLINVRNDNPCDTDKEYAANASLGGLFPTISFFPNEFGIYTLQGNVSEMTATEGVAAGGNYLLGMDQAHFNSTQSYSGPQTWLGFRCVAEKVKTEY